MVDTVSKSSFYITVSLLVGLADTVLKLLQYVIITDIKFAISGIRCKENISVSSDTLHCSSAKKVFQDAKTDLLLSLQPTYMNMNKNWQATNLILTKRENNLSDKFQVQT